MRKALLILLPLAALGFAPAPVYRERPNDREAILRRLQGGWRGVAFKQDGRDLFAGTPFRVSLEKDRWKFSTGNGAASHYTIALDTKAKPMRIDWREVDTHLVGLFEVSGDGFRYSFRDAAKGYPQSLTTPEADDYVVDLVREK